MQSRIAGALLLASTTALVAVLAPASPALAQDPCRAAAIQSPAPAAVISGTVAILGAARIDDFSFYKVEWAPESRAPSWSAVSSTVSQPLDGGVLDRWDTTRLPDGTYRLKLTVVDQQSQEVCRRTVSGLKVANQSPPPSPEASASPEDPADPTVIARAGRPAPGTGSPEPEDRDASTAAPEASSEATTADDEAADDEASAAAPTDTPPVEIAPPPVPRSGGFLPSFGELAFCFGSTFLATLAVVLWLWRRRDEWTG